MPKSASEQHLRTQQDELQRRYRTLTKRIAALDTDIGRELDSERQLVLEERLADLTTDRDRVQVELTEIEFRLSRSQETVPKVIGTAPPNGATKVPRDLTTIRIQFDRPMASDTMRA